MGKQLSYASVSCFSDSAARLASSPTTTSSADPAASFTGGTVVEALRRRLPPPMLVPRSGDGFNLVRKAPDPDTLVLPGGGAKGVAYVGLLRVMKEDGAFAGVNRLVGSSAGSIAATVIACTDNHQAMQDMLASELPTLLDTRADLRPVYPELSFHNTMSTGARALWRLTGGKPLGEANGLVQKFDDITGTAARSYLDDAMADPGGRADVRARLAGYAARRGLDTAQLMARIGTLRQAPDYTRDRTGRMVTFGDIEMLHHLAPDRFRTVEITAYAPQTGDIHYFDAGLTPQTPLAYATRASISHPLLATGVQIGADGPTLIDGGLRSNIPSEAVFDRDMARATGEPASRADEERRARTVVMQFDNGRGAGGGATAPAGRRGNVFGRFFSAAAAFFTTLPRRFMDWFMRLVSLNPRLDADRATDRAKFDAAGSNGLAMRHGTLRTVELDVPTRRQQEAIDDAVAGLREQLRQREDQGWFVTVDSVEEACAMLTGEERDSIALAGRPLPPDTSARDAAWAAYDAAKPAFLQAEADGDAATIERARTAMEQAEARMYAADAAHQHAVGRHRLAVRLWEMVARGRAGAPAAG